MRILLMFYVPKTQKSFSVASILRWSEALLCEENSDWETWFVPAEFIKKGQKLYREIPHAYALNLDLWTATLIFRLEDIGDVKIILSIDKNTKRLKWQSLATVDYALRASLAVAAIYFVEEFLAEESPRITLANEEKRVPALQEHSQFAPAVPAEIPEEPKYLRLSFKLNATLLSLNAEFVFLKKNQVPVNALKKQSETGIVLDNEDRTRLAKLGLCAHKAGFIFNAQEGVYELFGMTHIEIFVREHLDYWRQTFPQIQGITNLLNVFGKESTLIDTVAKLNSVRGNAFSVKYLFSLAGKLLSEDETRLLLANRDEGIYLPKHGVVKLRSRDNALLNDCQMKEDASLPIYSLLSLFQEKAGVTPEQIHSEVGSYGVPEFGTKFVRGMLVDTKPTTFDELIRISGLSHGTDVWLGNAQSLIESGTVTLNESICCRDDIMIYLIKKGVPPNPAFKIMETVRKGKALKDPEKWKGFVELMKEHDVPDWYIKSCEKIKYMFPKAHAAAYVTNAFRIAWFKVHQPAAYYAAYFTIRADEFDSDIMCYGEEKVKNKMKEIDLQGNSATTKDKNMYAILELVLEMYERGIKFLPMDLYKSSATKFIVEEEGIRPPLNSIPGLGTVAALGIEDAKQQGKFMSIDDMKIRSKIGKSVIEMLERVGCLKGMSQSNQMSLFG